jgi:hypothetical protein
MNEITAQTSNNNVKYCGDSSGPDSMDSTIVQRVCFVSLSGFNAKAGLRVTLRSGENVLLLIKQYSSENETLTVENAADGSIFKLGYILKDGRPFRITAVRDEKYPFNKFFDVFFN